MGSVIVPPDVLLYWRAHTRPDAIEPDGVLLGSEIRRGATWREPQLFESRRMRYTTIAPDDDYAMNNVADGTGIG